MKNLLGETVIEMVPKDEVMLTVEVSANSKFDLLKSLYSTANKFYGDEAFMVWGEVRVDLGAHGGYIGNATFTNSYSADE